MLQAQADGEMYVYVPDPDAVAQVMQQPESRALTIGQVVRRAFLQLAASPGWATCTPRRSTRRQPHPPNWGGAGFRGAHAAGLLRPH